MTTRKFKISELCNVTSSKRIFAKEYVENGIPFYRGKEITEKYKGALEVSTELFISEEYFNEIKSKHGVPVTGDLLLTSVGTLGSIYVVRSNDKFYFKDGNITWFKNFEGLSSQYLKYWLDSPNGKEELKKSTIGSSQSAYTISNLSQMEIDLPNINRQKGVVFVLKSYDDLIENNNRRIQIFEAIAQKLYQEWFVHYRFPGHEQAQWQETEQGRIPVGWGLKRATEVIEFAPKMRLPKEGMKPFVSMPNVSTDSMVIDEIEWREGNSGTKFQNGDTLLARITPCLQNGKTAFVQFLDEEYPIGFGSTEFIVMRSKNLTPEFVYCLARSAPFRGHAINSMAGADGRQRVKNDCFDAYYIAVPPKKLLAKFLTITEPVFKQVFSLNKKNKNLKQQRDLLLPKLIKI